MSKTTATPTKKVSRRDAIKILTAVAGATALANTPARWSKPELKVGVLPVHAQTSVGYALDTLPAVLVPLTQEGNACFDGRDVIFTAAISPQAAGILLQYTLTYTVTGASGSISSPTSLTDKKTTDASGQASLTVNVTPDSSGLGTEGFLTIVWSFVNPADGTNTVSQGMVINIGC